MGDASRAVMPLDPLGPYGAVALPRIPTPHWPTSNPSSPTS